MTVNNSGTNKFCNDSDLKIDLFLISEKKQKETYYNAQKKVHVFQKYWFSMFLLSYFKLFPIFYDFSSPKSA